MRFQSSVPLMTAVALGTVGTMAFLAQGADEPKADSAKITKAIAVLHPTQGSTVSGVVTFTQDGEKVRVQGEIRGLTPGKHGFHIHEFGDCSSPEAKSAGGHFNPKMEKHAGPHSHQRHVGDLGNIEANANGVAKIDVTDDLLTFHGAANIIGRGLIVHEKADDLKTQPTGDAGGRVACGVIGVAKGS